MRWSCTVLAALLPAAMGQHLLAPPAVWIRQLEALNAMQGQGFSKPVDATAGYLNALASILTSSSIACSPSLPEAEYMSCLRPMRRGTDWPAVGVTMAGHMRLDNIRRLLLRVHQSGVGGSYLEAGVWRGGMSVYAAAVVEAYGLDRDIYLCDSYEGLPAPRKGSLRSDETAYHTTLKPLFKNTAEAHVARNFDMYGVSRERVHFVKGFFVNSLPGLREQLAGRNERLSILRMDGDMYDATIDILYNLYDLVSVGGYVVIDDFGWTYGTHGEKAIWGAKDAVLDFRARHGIEDAEHAIRDIDGMGAWFQKTREVELQRERYLGCVRTNDYTPLQAEPKLTSADYRRLQRLYERHAASAAANSSAHAGGGSHGGSARPLPVPPTRHLGSHPSPGRAPWRTLVEL